MPASSTQASLIRIPGNIKSGYLPFRLMNDPQEFTFRSKGTGKEKGGILNICPSTIDAMFNDLSLKACFGKDREKDINKSMFFDNIPGIQIREFLPDTRLEQCINFFTDILGTVTDIFTKDKDALKKLQNDAPKTNPEGSTKSFFQILTEAMNWSLKYLTGSGQENLYKALNGDLNDFGGKGKWSGGSTKIDNYVLNFPFILYYRFQSCYTSALYELPCIKEDKQMYFSEGKGWNGSTTFELVNKFLGNVPVLGTLMKTILGNVRVNYLPWWDSESGQGTAEPEVTVKFDLFNDTDDAAINNFIFVNTIVPSNRWIQYNMFQHSSNLYDIKLEGYNRLFACTGKFEVKQQGVLRSPCKALVEKLLKYGANTGLSADDIIKDKLIKIPDVYNVTMTFSSLLPANFNNYIYTWTKNTNIITEYSGQKEQKSAATEMFNKGIKDFSTRLKIHWDEKSFDNPIDDDIMKAIDKAREAKDETKRKNENDPKTLKKAKEKQEKDRKTNYQKYV